MFGDDLRVEFGAEPLLQLDDEIGRAGRVEAHLRKGDVRTDRDRRVVDRAPDIGDAPVADRGLAHMTRRQTIPPFGSARPAATAGAGAVRPAPDRSRAVPV